jgi:hypothetical protein
MRRPALHLLTLVGLLTVSLLPASAQEVPADSVRADAPARYVLPDSLAEKYLDVGLRSPRTAFLLSLANTAVPILLGSGLADTDGSLPGTLVLYGIFVGPSVGHFYGRTGRGISGILQRGGGTVITAIGAGIALDNFFAGGNDRAETAAVALIYGGTLLVLGSAAYDVATAGRATRRANERRLERRASVSLSPTTLRLTGATQTGLRLALRF